MSRRFLAFVFAIALIGSDSAQGQVVYGTGMIMDDASYEAIPMTAPLMRGFGDLPQSVSLKRFAPTPGNQGRTGTCVGWATAYGARTIVAAIQNGWTDTATITANAFSPSYVYNQLRGRQGADPTCTRGAYIPQALSVMQQKGAAELSDFPFDCDLPVSIRDHEKAEPNKILEYSRLFDRDSGDKVRPVKRSLSEGKPVVIGMNLPTSFMNEFDGFWEPAEGEEASPYDGHAMTVIGYDDEKYGGAFEFLNSWGTRWGDKGFVWVRYDDFSEYVKYGFDVYAAQKLEADEPSLAGSLHLRLLSGREMASSLEGAFYRMNEVYTSGTEFEAFLTNEQPAYVYSIASDLSRKVTALVPHEAGISAFLSHAGSAVSLLPDDLTFYFDDRAGIDYLTVLYSARELDLASLTRDIEAGVGDYTQRLETALGDALVSTERVSYHADGMSFTAVSGPGGWVVPLTVEIEHAAASADRDLLPPVLTILDPAPSTNSRTLSVLPGVQTLTVRGTIYDDSGISYLLRDGQVTRVSTEGTFEFELGLASSGGSFELTFADAAGNRGVEAYTIEIEPGDESPPAISVFEPRVVKGKLKGIGVRKRKRTQVVRGTVTDPSGVAGVYINGVSAGLNGTQFTAEVLLASDEDVLEIRTVDSLGNEEIADYHILADDETEESFRAHPSYIVGDEDYATVEVFYGTDRAKTGSTLPSEFYGGDRGQLEYGRVSVSIPKGHSLGELESPVWWQFSFREDPSKHVALLEVAPLDRVVVLDEVRQVVSRSESKSAFVFVHGYNVSFEDAARRTAQVTYDLDFDGAPIFYSWPSDGRLASYTRDEADAEWTAAHLEIFLREIAESSGADRIHLVAHSMGNRPLTRALANLADETNEALFDQVVLAAPDIDADVFIRDLAPALPRVARGVTLYASSGDRALQASRTVHGYARAGDSGERLVVLEGIDTVDASGVSTDLIGHGYFAESEPILRDVNSLIRNGVGPGERGLIPQIKDVLTYWLLQVIQ